MWWTLGHSRLLSSQEGGDWILLETTVSNGANSTGRQRCPTMLWETSEFTLTCDISGLDHGISVGLPPRFDKLESPPLIVCLDGPWMFGTVLDATRIMSMSGEAPEAVVVGVSFTDQSMGEYLRQRARWYTPTPWVPPEETGVKSIDADECGKVETFLAFLNDQLLPRIEGQYHTSERWFIGHSFGALCGLRALMVKPEMFDRWLLASPSIWWDDRVILEMEEAYAEVNDDLPAHVFLSAGTDEDAGDPGNFRMTSNVAVLGTTLAARDYPNLSLTRMELQGDEHSSGIGNAVSKGLRALLKS
jgi:predicted alpha/beta superfamily hydrolase